MPARKRLSAPRFDKERLNAAFVRSLRVDGAPQKRGKRKADRGQAEKSQKIRERRKPQNKKRVNAQKSVCRAHETRAEFVGEKYAFFQFRARGKKRPVFFIQFYIKITHFRENYIMFTRKNQLIRPLVSKTYYAAFLSFLSKCSKVQFAVR